MITCQFCGAKNPVGASFCDSCGGALSSAVASKASAQAQAQAAQATAKQQAVRASQASPHFGTGRLPPRTLLNNRYLVLKTIGQGGMAAVYQASDTRANRVVAVKEMSQDGLSPDELRETLEGFTAEARMLQSLNHDNLPKVYESFSENARHYLVMEFIDGQTLEQRMIAARGALPEAEVMRWAAQLCAALDYLHTHNPPIIFRDLKPANIMVTPKGKIKLIDFGIARTFARNRTRDTQALGTPGYAPPEQYGSAQTDPRADIYALGATLYQLLTAYDVSKTPFALPPLQSRNPSISPQARRAIERATRLDRNQRYPNIREFQNDLLSPAGLYLQSGALARTPDELLALMAAQPTDGIDALYSGRTADWMTRWKRRDLADVATRTVKTYGDQAAGLKAFLASPTVGKRQRGKSASGVVWPGSPGTASPAGAGGSPGQRGALGPVMGAVATAVGVGVIAAVTSGAKSRSAGQANGAAAPSPLKAGMSAAVTSIASSIAGTATLPAVSPRELDLGPVTAGREVTGALTISAQNRLTATVKAQDSWITVDTTQFSGPRTIVTVSVRTGATQRGHQRGTIQLAVPGKDMLLPVIVDIVPLASPPPPPPPAPPWTPAAQSYSPASNGGSVNPAPVYPAPPKPAPARPQRRNRPVNSFAARDSGGLRFIVSLVVALGVAIGAPLALESLHKWLLTVLPNYISPTEFLLGLGALAAVVGVLVSYIGAPRVAGRARTTILGALIGGGLAFTVATWFTTITNSPLNQLFLAEGTSIAPLAAAIPIMVALGATLGAQSLVNRGMLGLARLIGYRTGFLLTMSAIAGGWLGVTTMAALHWTGLFGALADSCGLIVGVMGGLLMSQPFGMIARWFADVRP